MRSVKLEIIDLLGIAQFERKTDRVVSELLDYRFRLSTGTVSSDSFLDDVVQTRRAFLYSLQIMITCRLRLIENLLNLELAHA